MAFEEVQKLKSNESNFCIQVHLNGSDHNVCVEGVSVSMNPLRILNCTRNNFKTKTKI